MIDITDRLPKREIELLCRRYPVRELAVFGSALTEDFRPESDIDFLVEFQPGAQVGFMMLGRMERELAAIVRRPVDLVPKSGLRPQLRESILATSRVLYAA